MRGVSASCRPCNRMPSQNWQPSCKPNTGGIRRYSAQVGELCVSYNTLILWQDVVLTVGIEQKCRGPDSNRHGRYRPTDFKSVVSTIPPPRLYI